MGDWTNAVTTKAVGAATLFGSTSVPPRNEARSLVLDRGIDMKVVPQSGKYC